MEKRLKNLLDFQKFEENPSLQQVIDSVHSRYNVRELSLDEMGWVAAAGMPDKYADKKPGQKSQDDFHRS